MTARQFNSRSFSFSALRLKKYDAPRSEGKYFDLKTEIVLHNYAMMVLRVSYQCNISRFGVIRVKIDECTYE